MKKLRIIVILLIIAICSYLIINNNKIEEVNINNLSFEYNSKVYIKDIINEDCNDMFDTNKLGLNEKIIDINKKRYIVSYNVVDTTLPIIKGSGSITIKTNTDIDLINKYLCGDNYDKKPNCYIEGDYDTTIAGEYNLVYNAIDSSNNKTTKDIKLIVKDEIINVPYSNPDKVDISEFIKEYKTDNTKIGIDVSEWQGNIDWDKVKNSGVEFAILRLGFGSKDNYKIDSKFLQNLEETKRVGIPIGVYFYSYATSNEEALSDARWVIETLNNEKLDYGIAFDWENWGSYNSYNLSFKDLNDIANTFINEVKKNNYDGMLYTSASYLNGIWDRTYLTWIAYYIDKNDYVGDYKIWQLSDIGGVDGINAYVDMNIMYE